MQEKIRKNIDGVWSRRLLDVVYSFHEGGLIGHNSMQRVLSITVKCQRFRILQPRVVREGSFRQLQTIAKLIKRHKSVGGEEEALKNSRLYTVGAVELHVKFDKKFPSSLAYTSQVIE